MSRSYVDHRLDEFLLLVAAREPAPGGGAVAALTVSLAAGLVAMAARYSDRQLPGTERVVSDMERFRQRAALLADTDSDTYRAVIAVSEATRDADPAYRHTQLRSALHRAAEVPLEVTQVGAAIARAGAPIVRQGSPSARGDALTGVLLAEAAVRCAAHLVAINVQAGGCDEELVGRATRNVELAADAARSAQEPVDAD